VSLFLAACVLRDVVALSSGAPVALLSPLAWNLRTGMGLAS
jgi:hypothetical protein